jgi:transposase
LGDPEQQTNRCLRILQADCYKGYAKLCAFEPDGASRLREAACWAHLRRDFHDVWTSTKSEVARAALDLIGEFYDIERDIAGQPDDVKQPMKRDSPLNREGRSGLESDMPVSSQSKGGW